jgi:PAS domain S-box-containing protein
METKEVKILAIDDNPDNLISLNALIKEAFPDARTLTALNGANGLELAAAEEPDLILLDIVMPGMDGFEVCRKLKADKAMSDIPVVFITALKGDKQSRILALECGAEAFLAKPIDETELTAQIRAMVKIKNAHIEKRNEKERLAALVAERTCELEFELAERIKAENALRESEERFRSVTQSANDAIVTINSFGAVYGWNKGAEKLFGYSEDEITGKDLTIIMPQDIAAKHGNHVNRVVQGGIPQALGKTIEKTGIHKNGTVFPIELSISQWTSSAGMFFTGIIRDISERKKAEAIIIESEQKYRGLLMNLDAGVVVHSPDTSIILSNPRASVLLGLSAEQMQGKQAIAPEWKFVYENLTPIPLDQYPVNQVKNTKKSLHDFVLGVNHPVSDKITWLIVNGFPLIDDANELTEILISFVDITNQKQATAALRESEQKYRDIFNSVRDVFYQTDLDGILIDISPSIYSFLGFDRDELCGKPVNDLYLEKNDRNGLLNEIRRYGELRDYEITLKSKTGEIKYASVNASLMLGANGETTHINGALRDITSRKQAEEALHESETNYRDLVEKLPDGIYKSTEAGKFVNINPAMATILGYDNMDELMAIDIKTQLYFEETDREMVELHEGNTEIGIYRMKKKDGSEVWVEDHGWLVLDENRNTIFHEGIIRDVTERKKAQEEIEKIGHYYKGIIENAPDGIVLIDKEGKMAFASPSARRMFGYAPEEEFVDNPAALTHPDDQAMVLGELTHLMQDPRYVPTIQYRFIDKKGTWRWIESTFTNLVANPSIEGIVINFREISESKAIQDELKASEDKYRTMIEFSNDLIWTLDREGNFIFLNETALKTTGLSLDVWKGKSFLPLILEEDLTMILDVFAKSLSGKPCNYELRFKKGDDSILTISVNTSPIYVSGKVEGIVSFGRDITESKQAENQLKLLGRAVEQSPATIVITNKDGNIEYVNPKFTSVSNYTLDEVKGKNPRILQSGEQTKDFYIKLWETVLSGNVWQGEFHNKKKNGESYWESAAISAITNNKGEVSFFLAVKEDITDKKKMIGELIKAKEKAEESDRLKSAFLANMSHEIRTPMNGILGFANLLKEPGLSGEQQQEYIKIIEKSGDRMLNIIKDIVDISKIEARLMEVDVRQSDVNEQTDFVYTFFKPEVESKGMKLSIKNGLSGRDAFIKTDREKLYAILTNLIKNAIKYSDHGTIEFGYVLKNPAPGDAMAMLQFFVKDTGIGIPADRIHAIFDRFVQADIADKRAFQGAGLGLSISKAFIEMLGGEIWVESEEGKGSTFFFTLPYQMPVEDKPISTPILPVAEPENQIHGLKIMIAEDDPTSEMLISMALKIYSKELIKVRTGIEAVETCRNNPDIDLIMMDIKMPILNGYDATQQIRGFNKDVVIIAQTAYALIHEKEFAIQAGCDDYISKPISVELLRQIVRKYFHK